MRSRLAMSASSFAIMIDEAWFTSRKNSGLHNAYQDDASLLP